VFGAPSAVILRSFVRRLASMTEARVKIVATVGPASRTRETMEALARAGVDVLRVNGAHAGPSEIAAVVRDARLAARAARRVVAVLVDLPGAKVRIGDLRGGQAVLRRGDRVLLARGRGRGDATRVPASAAVLATVARGAEVLLGDGAVGLRVERVGRGGATCRVTAGGLVRSRAGIHVRGARHGGRVPTANDVRLARAAVRAGADALALSFVRGPGDLAALRRAITRKGTGDPVLVAKLERREGVESLESILSACDGVMVARGDLGLEYEPEEVPVLQKRIVEAAARHGRFAITATQMLESMTTAPRPTRAEASDVANAVFDGTDAVMLSGETAVGVDPPHVAAVMNRILVAAEADPHCPYAGDARHPSPEADASRPDRLVVRAAVRLANEAKAAAVVVFTRGGQSARRLAKERPRAPVYAYASDERVVRGLALSWGVRPRRMAAGGTTDAAIRAVVARLRREERLRPGSRVVLVMGGARDPAGTTSLVKLVTL
jgi:pyruvate kinase